MNDNLYHQRIVELAQAATGDLGGGGLEGADGSASEDNYLCGDRATMEVKTEAGRIAALGHRIKGCLLCRAAASIIGSRAPGAGMAEVRRSLADAERLLKERSDLPGGAWTEIEAFKPVAAFKARHECVLLPFRALVKALDEADTAIDKHVHGSGK